jgi:hypothetical protein
MHRFLYLLIWSDVDVQHLLGTKSSENHWMPNLVNMADGVTPPILILNLFHGMMACIRMGTVMLQTNAMTQQTMVFSSNCWLKLI